MGDELTAGGQGSREPTQDLGKERLAPEGGPSLGDREPKKEHGPGWAGRREGCGWWEECQ